MDEYVCDTGRAYEDKPHRAVTNDTSRWLRFVPTALGRKNAIVPAVNGWANLWRASGAISWAQLLGFVPTVTAGPSTRAEALGRDDTLMKGAQR